jgi:hypothetical protein
MSIKTQKLYMLQTTKGIVTLDGPDHLAEWMNTGMNRFTLQGPAILEEIEVDLLDTEISKTVYVGVDWEALEVVFFDDEIKATEWEGDGEKRELEAHTVRYN